MRPGTIVGGSSGSVLRLIGGPRGWASSCRSAIGELARVIPERLPRSQTEDTSLKRKRRKVRLTEHGHTAST